MPTIRDRAWAEYSEQFRKRTLPQLLKSDITLTVYEGGDDPPVKAATEIGMMLLMGKPILVVALPDVPLPAGLMRAADEIVEADPSTDEGQTEITAALRRMTARLNEDP